MPTNKDFKRLVRARMQKTGEAYTTARSHLLDRRRQSAVSSQSAAGTPDFGRLAGMSDATMKEKTGCTWDRWVRALDHVGAHEWSHRQIAEHVSEKYKVSGWWSQTVTVGYERIKGLRGIGQRRGGGYEVNKSKTFNVALGRLYRAFHDARTRRRWLGEVKFTVRTATRDKSMRLTWPDATSVVLYFESKGTGKSQVVIQHEKLADKAGADRMKSYWTERLTALQGMLVPTRR